MLSLSQVAVSSEKTGPIGSCSVKVSEIKGAPRLPAWNGPDQFYPENYSPAHAVFRFDSPLAYCGTCT